jgi:hypothetical protein
LDLQERKAGQQLRLGISVGREVRADSQNAIDVIGFGDVRHEAIVDHKLLDAGPSRRIEQPSKGFRQSSVSSSLADLPPSR